MLTWFLFSNYYVLFWKIPWSSQTVNLLKEYTDGLSEMKPFWMVVYRKATRRL